MKKGLLGCAIIAATFLLVPVFCLANTKAPSYQNYPISAEKEIPNGEFTIYVMKDGGWQKVGNIPFDSYFRDKELSLPGNMGDGWKIRIKIEEKGGGAAHIDSAFLGGRPPVEVKDVSDGLKKLSKKDFDVIDAFGKSIEVVFVSPVSDKTLRLAARIEPVVNVGMPFQFPPGNLGKTIDTDSSFYTYKLDSVTGGIKMDGSMDEVKSRKPFFKEFSLAGSGHPSSYTYGWVWNDDKNLFVAIDFTGDNTMDGDKDYTKVYVNTDRGVKEFRISESETKWGRPAFSYTDKVPYQHKIYKFQIPLQEIVSEDTKKKDELLLAFSAYGTELFQCIDSYTLPSAVGPGMITVTSLTQGCYFTLINALSGNEVSTQDLIYTYPQGLVQFVLNCAIPCGTTQSSSMIKNQQDLAPIAPHVEVTFTGIDDISQTTIRKFGPTPDNTTNHWYSFEWDGTTGASQKSGSSFVANYVDGSRGDDDLNSTNMIIVDQIGPGQQQANIPTMTEWGMIIFLVIAGLGSIHFLTKRKERAGL